MIKILSTCSVNSGFTEDREGTQGDDAKIQVYLARFNTLCNLELLTESENLSKNATPFDEWLKSRDAAFRVRHLIPDIAEYSIDFFENFSKERAKLITLKLQLLSATCVQFEGEEDIVPIFSEQRIPTPPKTVKVAHIDDHLGYIIDAQVRAKALALLNEIKQWKPGSISLDAIKYAISMKINGRVFAYFWPRRQFYLLGTNDEHEEWKEFPIKDDDDLANAKAMMRAAMERLAK